MPPRPTLLLSLGLLLTALSFGPARAQGEIHCFAETGYCIGGRIRQFWERGGGLAALGLPITPVQEELVEGQLRWVQWFERARLELHPEHAAPYDVLLGRVGAERLARPPARAEPGRDVHHLAGDCRIFEGGHSVCGEFLVAWGSYGLGLDADPALSPTESLALFGLPISGPQVERVGAGPERLVQWFERARFEYHPELGWPHRVLFGLVGSELSPRATAPPGSPAALVEPPPPPPPAPGSEAARPARIVIPAIGLDRVIVPAGVDDSGGYIVPPHDVGWFHFSATPRQGENIVLWGHVLPFSNAPGLPAPFASLQHLTPGARLTLYDLAGSPHSYVVSDQIWATPDQVAYILPQGREIVTMVSCIGDDVLVGGAVVDKTHRLITVAVPGE